MVRFTLKQCRYFLAVAEHGGIAQAARALSISQPAVTQAIDKLEALTGLQLFERHHARGMELTRQGKAFREEAHALTDRAGRMNDAIADIAGNRRGTIRLGCFQSIAPFCLARIVREHGAQHPDIAIDVVEALQRDLELALVAGDLDLAIMYDLGLDPPLISTREIMKARPYVIVSEKHRLGRRRRVSLRELAGDGYVLFDAPSSKDYFAGVFAAQGLSPQIAFRSTSFESVRSAVAHNLGFSILAMRPASPVTYDGERVVPVEIAEDIKPLSVVIAQRNAGAEDRLTRDFTRFCATIFRTRASLRGRIY